MASRELSILVTARNMASRVLGQVRGDIGGVEGAARRASSNVSRNLGLAGAAIAGGIALQVRSGIESLVELERVENLTAAALESTGNLANQSAAGIRARSEAMESMSGVDDKVIQNAQNLLLTFTNVREDAFEPTLEAAVNLNAALGGGDEGLQGILIQVAKAMNDPVRGMTALRRSGVSFTEAQQDQVKAMMEANDLAGAQAIILGELETQFGGAAEAANQGVGASQRKFADAIEDMQMALATGFLPLITRVSEKLQELVANPAFLAGVEEFGNVVAGGFDSALDFAESVDWGAVGNAFGIMGSGAKTAMDAFLGAPPWLQTAIITGWGLNKLTGGALGGIVGELGKGLIRGILNMNAAVVNVRGEVVNGPGGGVPTTPGGRPGGRPGGGKFPFLPFGLGPLGAITAPLVLSGSNNQEALLSQARGQLERGELTPAEFESLWGAYLGRSVTAKVNALGQSGTSQWARGQSGVPVASGTSEWAKALNGIKGAIQSLPDTAVLRKESPAAILPDTAMAPVTARLAPLATLPHILTTQRTATQVQRETRDADRAMLTAASFQTSLLRSVSASSNRTANKNWAPTVRADVHVTNNLSINEWQRTVSSSVRASTPTTPTAI